MFTIVDIVLEANPNNFELLCERVSALALKEDPKTTNALSFLRLKQIDQLHFMSLQIFRDRHYDPLLVFENNFDGDSDSYWQAVLQQIGDELRGIFACTKPATNSRWAGLFKDGATDATDPLVPFIREFSVSPSAQHFGAVGLTAARIKRDQSVFATIQSELGDKLRTLPGQTSVDLHKDLRASVLQKLLPKYPKLADSGQRTVKQERLFFRLAAVWRGLPWVVAVLAGLALILTPIFLCISEFLRNHVFAGTPWWVSLALSVIVLALLGFVGFWAPLRSLEKTDMTQDDPVLDTAQLEAFAAQEDQIVQNHLASMVLVKPGALRGAVIRVALRVLKQFVPVWYANGYLSTMRTIHFAHWTLVGNTGRLMFLSNFDGSWQSYLDDFVDKAHEGLTLAWGNCVGFPPTKNLVQEGATHGRQFKAWARQSQTQNILWYSAYADLTVNQVLRNATIVDGIRKSSMTKVEADAWVQLL